MTAEALARLPKVTAFATVGSPPGPPWMTGPGASISIAGLIQSFRAALFDSIQA